MSSAAHPQMDGQTEVLNQHLEVMLPAYVNSSRDDWDQFLDMLMFAYNNSMHTAIKEKPATLLFGYEPLGLLGLLRQDSPNILEECATLMLERCQSAESTIRTTQERQVRAHNSKHQTIAYQEGDLVLLDPHQLNLINMQGTGCKLMQH